jgi:hypothetical protein
MGLLDKILGRGKKAAGDVDTAAKPVPHEEPAPEAPAAAAPEPPSQDSPGTTP